MCRSCLASGATLLAAGREGLDHANGFTGPVQFMDTAAFDEPALTPHSEARVDNSGGNTTRQIEVNGDSLMDSHDIEIQRFEEAAGSQSALYDRLHRKRRSARRSAGRRNFSTACGLF
jgi:hypothetical protein